VGDQEHRGAALAQQLDRRHGGADARVVGDRAGGQGHVQVGAHEDGASLHIRVANARLRERPASHLAGGVAQAPTAAGSSTFAASSTQRFE
jgi:hypothetical protein